MLTVRAQEKEQEFLYWAHISNSHTERNYPTDVTFMAQKLAGNCFYL